MTAVSAANNIFMLVDASSASLIAGCNTNYSLMDADSTGNTGTHTDTLSENATFVDAMNGNFHLASGSEGIDDANPAATLATDIDGDARPAGMADMGADEFVSQ
ncbi:MAG: hypothetical protein GY811_12785 [Myxococcales bacterium]|nr:hypothetical protein [Myxococcales bacterium]